MSNDLGVSSVEPEQGVAAQCLSERVKLIKLSPTIAMAERAAAMRKEGRDVIGLSVGEPDFPTPEHAIEAAHYAALEGHTKYTAPDGEEFVKKAVCDKLARDNGLEFNTAQIGVVSGCKQVIFNAMGATIDAGDEVVIFAPYWVSYADMVEYYGGKPVIIQTCPDRGFLPDVSALEKLLGIRTKWILLNSPNNPTGAVYPGELLNQIADVVLRHPSAMVLSDEIYEQLVYDGGRHLSILNVAPHARHRVLVVNGVSKTYSMTGWRSGFGAGPEWLIEAMAKVQSQSAGSSNSIGQRAAAAAMTGEQTLVATRRATLEKRRDLAVEILKGANRLAVQCPRGAFYLFADVSRCIGGRTRTGGILKNDKDVSAYLLDTAGVATVPGEAFGTSPFVRLSFALEESLVAEACTRIVAACNDLDIPSDQLDRQTPDPKRH